MARWAVLVVHGVGETTPGNTVDAFVPALAAARGGSLRPDGLVEVRHLRPEGSPAPGPDPAATPPRDEACFPVHVRRAEIDLAAEVPPEVPREAVFAEVYWADLSRVRVGWVHTVLALISTVFLVRFLADQAAVTPPDPAADSARRPARWLRALLYLIALLLNGPMTALFVLLLAALLVDHVAMPSLVGSWYELGSARGAVMIGIGVVAAVAGAIAWWKGRRAGWGSSWTRVCGALAPTGLAFAMAVALSRWLGGEAWVAGVARWVGLDLSRINGALGPIRLLDAPVLLLAGVQATFDVIALQVVLAFVALLFAVAGTRREWRPALSAAFGATLLQLVLWMLLLPPLTQRLLRMVASDPARRGGIEKILERFDHGFTAFAGVALVVGVAVFITWLRRDAWTKAHRGEYEYPPPVRDIPRLIVDDWVVGLLIALMLGACAAALATVLMDRPLGTPSGLTRVVVPAAVVLLGVALTSFSSGLLSALHVLTDIINHFYRRRDPLPLPWGDEERIDVRDFEIQQRIESRFRAVLAEVLRDPEVTRLSVVSHSQGTIIAADVFSLAGMDPVFRGWLSQRLCDVGRLGLLTMGSPVTHLYQHYFPARYAPFSSPRAWLHLHTSLASWVNVYRVDDYIGTFVEQAATWPIHNVPIHAGGHIAYWDQPAVFRAALAVEPHLLPG